MFAQQFDQFKNYFRPYIQQVPAEEVFIGTILFYVIFSLAFFMADHGNIECAANIIMFYNSWIVCFAILLYLITANIVCCVIAVASFLASSLAEIVLGTLYYPSRMFLSTYLHHIIYSIYAIGSIYFNTPSFTIGIIAACIELSAIFQSIKRIWNVKSMAFDIVNAAVFFFIRIIVWVPLMIAMYLWCESTAEKASVGFMSLFFFFHVFWSWTQIRNLHRRYFTINGTINNDINELYLTPDSLN